MPFVESAKFPAAVAAVSDLLNWKNVATGNPVPTLSATILSTDTSFTLTAGTGQYLPSDNFVVTIDSEIIFVGSRSTDTLSGLVRGYEGTTAAGHNSGAGVKSLVTAHSHNQLATEVNAIEAALGVTLSNVRKNAQQAVGYSTTPSFDATDYDSFKLTLGGNVTSSTLTGLVAGQFLTFIIVQDTNGGHSFVWPTNVKDGIAIGSSASPNEVFVQSFISDGTNCYPVVPRVVGEISVSSNTTLSATGGYDHVWATAGASGITVTLPDATTISGRRYTIKRVDSAAGNVTIATTSSQKIDADLTYILSNQYQRVTVVSDGSNWQITNEG